MCHIFAICYESSFFFCFFFFRATPTTYGSSQARGQIWAVAAGYATTTTMQDPSPTYATYTIAQGNAGSLTDWVRPEIKPISSWMLVRFATTERQVEFQQLSNTIIVHEIYIYIPKLFTHSRLERWKEKKEKKCLGLNVVSSYQQSFFNIYFNKADILL